MKKVFFQLFVCFFVVCGTLHAQPVPLPQAIKNAVDEIEQKIAEEKVIAVINFDSTQRMSDYVINQLISELVKRDKIKVIERQKLDLIENEMNYQLSSAVSDESAKSIGKQLGADLVITGSYSDQGSFGQFTIKVLNVETAEIECAPVEAVLKDTQVKGLLNSSGTLAQTIKNAVDEIEQKITEEKTIAVINFDSTQKMSDYVINRLVSELVKRDKFTVVERQQLNLIENEMNYQLSGEVSDDSAQAIGAKLGADLVITGSYSDQGSTGQFTIKVLNVETAKVEYMANETIQEDAEIKNLLGSEVMKNIATGGKSILDGFANFGKKIRGFMDTAENLSEMHWGITIGGGGYFLKETKKDSNNYSSSSSRDEPSMKSEIFSLSGELGVGLWNFEAKLDFSTSTILTGEYYYSTETVKTPATEIGVGAGAGYVWDYAAVYAVGGANLFFRKENTFFVPYLAVKFDVMLTPLKGVSSTHWLGNFLSINQYGWDRFALGVRVRYDLEFFFGGEALASTDEPEYFSPIQVSPMGDSLELCHKITVSAVVYFK